ncbi:MAG: glycosyltransferase family 4 protein [Oscillospiraceae bacterium]|nr:glycosyltransferase family 4 protein [Oscillospiraceae bacterium]
MKKVLFLTNYPSPYRVQFFDELGKFMDVTVLFSERKEDKTHRSADWYLESEGRFQAVQLNRTAMIKGRDLCLDVTQWLKKSWDAIVLCGYSSPTVMVAMAWLRMHGIPFCMEVDGGLVRQDSKARYLFKKTLVSTASYWISSGKETTKYLVHYGAREDKVYHYPFTSLWEKDILSRQPSLEEKQQLRQKLGMKEQKIALYVGRYDPKKGMDELLGIVPELDKDTGVYFVGGEPTQSHRQFCAEQQLENAHFVGFTKKDALAEYYKAADVLVLPTWSDVWGLVVNEAMSFGLPVITTDRCVAGMELVENGVNGYIVPIQSPQLLRDRIQTLLQQDYRQMGAAALETVRPYTIENMAKSHVTIFTQQEK